MMSVDYTTKQLTLHEVRPERSDEHGAINARDVGDFLHQVNQRFRATTGMDPVDDSYDVRGDEEGLVASWRTETSGEAGGTLVPNPGGGKPLTRHQVAIRLLERTRDALRAADLSGAVFDGLRDDIIKLIGGPR